MNPADWSRIDELFNEAIGLPAEQRAAFLDTACDTPSIRHEVEQMLRHDAPTDSGFDDAVKAAAVTMVDEKRSWVIGRRIGPYRVTGILGEGGMGTVYGAVRDDDAYEKEVAIKLVRYGFESGKVLERFRTERQILARLEHPYIARLLDGGAATDGMPYLVMERIQGSPITRYANEHQLLLEDRLQLFLKVCEAVQYAHSLLVIHRDIKPANILITEEGTPRLLDFGLARVLADEQSEPQTTGAFLMTPAYASPEQISGNAMTTSTDVYSLGAVLYELLTGQQPHKLTGLSPLDAATVICRNEPELASRVASNPRIPARQLSGDLDNILHMALRKEPGRRYRSVEQFAADLQKHLEGLPVLARTDVLSYRAAKFAQRNRWFLAAGAVVFLVLAIGVITSQRAARRERRRFDQVRQLVNRVLFQVHDAILPLQGSLPARELIIQNALEYLNSLSTEASGDPALLNELSAAYRKLGSLQGAILSPSRGDVRASRHSLNQSVQLARQAVARQPRNPEFLRGLALALFELTRIEAHSSNFSEARALGQESISALDRALSLQPSASLSEELGQVYTFLGIDVLAPLRDKGAAAMVQKGIAISEALVASHPAAEPKDKLASAYGSLGRLLALNKDTEGSRNAYQRAIAIREQLVREHPENAGYRRGLLVTYGGLADRIAEACTEERVPGAAAARPIYEKMVALAREAAGDPKDRTSQTDLGQALLRLGCLEDNEGNASQSVSLILEGLARTRPFSDPDTAPTGLLLLRVNLLQRYGRVLLSQNKVAEAGAQFREALHIISAVERRAAVADVWGRKLTVFGRLAMVAALQRDRNGLDALTALTQREIESHAQLRLPPSSLPPAAIAHMRFARAYETLQQTREACWWWQASARFWRMSDEAGAISPGYQTMPHEAFTHATQCKP